MKKLKRIFAVFFCLLLAAGILGGCGKAASSSAPAPSALQSGNKPLKIVTTIFPEYDWVREILGDKADHAEVTMLLDNGVDLHSYQPPQMILLKSQTVTCSSMLAANRMAGWKMLERSHQQKYESYQSA